MSERFWENKSLQELSRSEWESLCDGCAKCCLQKLEDEDTGDIYCTDVACHLLDQSSCACSDYANRTERVPACVDVSEELEAALDWMPETCAYRRMAFGQPLPLWHHLITGDRNSIHEQGMSVRGRVVTESPELDLESRIVDWPC